MGIGIDEKRDRWEDRQMERHKNGKTYRWEDEKMGRHIDGKTDGKTVRGETGKMRKRIDQHYFKDWWGTAVCQTGAYTVCWSL